MTNRYEVLKEDGSTTIILADESFVRDKYEKYSLVPVADSLVKPIRRISINAFRHRFTREMRKNIRESVVDDVIDVNEDLSFAQFVDLDSPLTLEGMQVLVDNGILTNEERMSILRDGFAEESY